jgi:hypothetical protein
MSYVTNSAVPTYVGKRVAWRGTTLRGFIPHGQQRAIIDGTQPLPAPEDMLELHPGDQGEVIELVTVTSAGHAYAIRFANDYEIEAVLPSTVTPFVDEPPSPRSERPRRYATYSTPRRWAKGLWRRWFTAR